MLDRLFAQAEPIAPADVQPAATTGSAATHNQRPPEAPIEMRLRWIREVAEMRPDALEQFEQQTFRQWDRGSLVAVRRAIERATPGA